jgi:uncharacterized protein (TIGR00661 family)
MKVLYGVNGEGMGHATRSEVVIKSLLERHRVRVFASGAAFRHLSERLPAVDQVFGPTFAMGEGQIRRWQTVVQNFRSAREELPEGVKVWAEEVDEWQPDVVISDFEPVSAGFARWARTPLVAVDNINVIDRCRHGRRIIGAERDEYLIARALVRGMVPGAAEYVVTTFFRPPLARKRTTLVPPILRSEIASAKSEEGEHLVVYWGGEEKLLESLRRSGVRCLIYGMRGGPDEARADGNLEFRPPSNEGFVEALRTCRGVVAGGGFSLLSEAVYLGKPVLSVPLRGQFEQLINARYLQARRYGLCAEDFADDPVARFLEELPSFREALSTYRQDGNAVALKAIEERAEAAVEARPARGSRRQRRRRRAAG